MKILITIVLSVVGTLGVLFGLGAVMATMYRGNAPGQADLPATTVRTETVERGELIEFISAPGQVEPKTKVSISARVSARIARLPCEEGEQVFGPRPREGAGDGSAGDSLANGESTATLLVELDATDLKAALRAAEARKASQIASMDVDRARIAAQEASLRATEAQLKQARADLVRQEDLLKTGDVADKAVEELATQVVRLEADLDAGRQNLLAAQKNQIVLEHNLEEAEAQIEKAKDDLSYTTIYSPIDGVVTQINSEVGEVVIAGTTNNQGTIILEVADLSRMLLVAQVDEADIGQVKLGQKAKVRIQAYSGREFDGEVTSIALVATDEPSKHFKVEILLDTGGDRIYSGLTADVDIHTAKHEDVIRIPSQAVLGRASSSVPDDIKKDNKYFDEKKTIVPVVFRVKDGKAVITPVTIGPSDLTHTVIKGGLETGERIVTGPFTVLESLQHDQMVKDEAGKLPGAAKPAADEKKQGAPAAAAQP